MLDETTLVMTAIDRHLKPARRTKPPVTVAKVVVQREKLGHRYQVTAEKLRSIIENLNGPGNDAASAEYVIDLAIDASAYEPSAKARALLRGVEQVQTVLRETGGAYSLDQVQALLGITRQAVDKKVKEGALLAVPGPSGRRQYPVIQFTQSGGALPGLRDIIAKLPMNNPFSVLIFLASPLDLLDDKKPVDLLKAGEVDLVKRAAGLLIEQGA